LVLAAAATMGYFPLHKDIFIPLKRDLQGIAGSLYDLSTARFERPVRATGSAFARCFANVPGWQCTLVAVRNVA
jgi:hypothetical protein